MQYMGGKFHIAGQISGLRGSDGKGKRTIETVFMHESIVPRETFRLTTQEGLFDV